MFVRLKKRKMVQTRSSRKWIVRRSRRIDESEGQRPRFSLGKVGVRIGHWIGFVFGVE